MKPVHVSGGHCTQQLTVFNWPQAVSTIYSQGWPGNTRVVITGWYFPGNIINVIIFNFALPFIVIFITYLEEIIPS